MATSLNLNGQVFGDLQVLKQVESDKWGTTRWEVICSCGNHRTYRVHDLTSGRKTHCGCKTVRKSKFETLTGKRFGRLVVVSEGGFNQYNHKLWKCKCDCGNTTNVYTSQLTTGQTKSCGCLVGELKDRDEAILRQLYANLSQRGGFKKSPTSLPFEEYMEKSLSNCHYCGAEPMNTYKDKRNGKTHILHYNGLDRLDSSKGYTSENTVPCCPACNMHKKTKTVEQFEKELDERAIQILKFRFGVDMSHLLSQKGGETYEEKQ